MLLVAQRGSRVKDVQIFDGVAVVTCGITFVSMWQHAALLDRVRWHGALLEQHVAKHAGEALGLMIVLETAPPPQGEARLESNAIVKRISPNLRLGVTAALGETLQVQVVRTVMRGMFLLSGQAKRHVVVSSEAEGIDRILALQTDRAEASTLGRYELEDMVNSLREALAPNLRSSGVLALESNWAAGPSSRIDGRSR